MHIHGINFQQVLAFNEVDYENGDEPIVEYDVEVPSFLDVERGIYLMLDGKEILYCGMFSNTFAKRLLYTRLGYVYHFKRPKIANRIRSGSQIDVYGAEESEIKSQLGETENPWINVNGIESELIRRLNPTWNSIGTR